MLHSDKKMSSHVRFNQTFVHLLVTTVYSLAVHGIWWYINHPI